MADRRVVEIADALRAGDGEELTVRGWVYRHRDLGEKVFLVVRDSTGIIQVVFSGKLAPLAREADVESSVVVSGLVKSDPRAPGGKEIVGNLLEIVGPS
ncbi:MAG: OB-fold nucleic acid binding domain-containing protein, partial [Thermofilaceae archaeon]